MRRLRPGPRCPARAPLPRLAGVALALALAACERAAPAGGGGAPPEPAAAPCPPETDCPEGWTCGCDAAGHVRVEERDTNGDGRIDTRWIHRYDDAGNFVGADPYFSDAVLPPAPRYIARATAWEAISARLAEASAARVTGEALPLPPLSPVEEATLALDRFAGWTVVPLAQLERGARVVIVMWPAVDPSGEVADDDLVAVTWEVAEGEPPRLLSANGSATREGALERALGGPVERVQDRAEGAPMDQLGPLLSTLPQGFADAVARADRPAAVDAARRFARLFSLDTATTRDTVAELLLHATRGKRFAVLDARRDDDGAVLRAWSPDYSGDWIVESRVRAVRVAGSEDRWVVRFD